MVARVACRGCAASTVLLLSLYFVRRVGGCGQGIFNENPSEYEAESTLQLCYIFVPILRRVADLMNT